MGYSGVDMKMFVGFSFFFTTFFLEDLKGFLKQGTARADMQEV